MSEMPNKIGAANAGWRTQFRYRGSRHWSGMADLTSEVIRQRFF
jgi:hypothetical protein